MENLELEIEKLREELSSIYRDEEKIVHVINTIMEQLKIASLRCDNAIAISRNMKYLTRVLLQIKEYAIQ